MIEQLLTRLELPSIAALIAVHNRLDSINNIPKSIAVKEKQDVADLDLLRFEGVWLVAPGAGDVAFPEHKVEIPNILVRLGAIKSGGLFGGFFLFGTGHLLIGLCVTGFEVGNLSLQVADLMIQTGILVLQIPNLLVGVSSQLIPDSKQATQAVRTSNVRVVDVDSQMLEDVEPGEDLGLDLEGGIDVLVEWQRFSESIPDVGDVLSGPRHCI